MILSKPAVFIFFLVFCGTAVGQPEPIKVGAILILSGLGAEQGINSQRGATLATEEINAAGGFNGRPLKLIFEDEVGPNPKGAVTAYRKLTTVDKVSFILGPQWLNEVQAVDPLAVKDNVFLVIPSTCGPTLSKNTFCLWADPVQEMESFAEYIYSRQKTVVTFASTEPWESLCIESFKNRYEQLGGKVLDSLLPNENSSDVRTEALKSKAANPEAIVTCGLIHFAQYTQFLRKFDVKAQIYASELFQELINAAGPAAENIVYITPTLPDAVFSEKFAKRFSATPDIPATQAYDGIRMLAKAIAEEGNNFHGVQHFFQTFKEYKGAIGAIREKEGRAIVPTGLYTIQAGRPIRID